MRVEEAMSVIASALRGQFSPEMLTSQVRTTLISLCDGRATGPTGPPGLVKALEPFLKHRSNSDTNLAELYEETLQWEVKGEGEAALVVPSAGERRRSGRYYTPDLITRHMADRALLHAPGARTAIDPACGTGAFLKALQERFNPDRLRLVGLDSDPLALALCRSRIPEADLRHSDALLSEEEGLYDICLANPPYVTGGLRGMRGHNVAGWTQLRSRYSTTSQYKFSTYPLFVERGLRLLREGGVAGYILPDSFLTGKYFEGLRRLLAVNTLLELTLIRSDFWSHGRVGQSVIIFVRKASPPPDHHVMVRSVDEPHSLDNTAYISRPLSELMWGQRLRFRLVTREADRTFIQAVEAGAKQRMGDLVKSYSGLIGRHGQRSLLLSENPGWSGPTAPLLRSGAEVDRYSVRWAGAHVCLEPARIKSGGNVAYYRQPKLLMRQTADSLRAAYDDTGLFCLNNLHLITTRSDMTILKPALAVINSDALNRYYRLAAMESGRVYAQVDLDLFDDLPVPEMNEETNGRLTELVTGMGKAAPAERAAMGLEIDRLVHRAYGLG